MEQTTIDPHLRTTRLWQGDRDTSVDDLSLDQIYTLAAKEGYIFPQLDGIGYIGSEELDMLASHPPVVALFDYLKYRDMTVEELALDFPEAYQLIKKHLNRDPTYEDMFYYATREWIPEYDSLNTQLKRYNTYSDLSKVGKQLLDLMYGDHIGFATKFGHPLEKYVIEYDKNMDDQNVLRSIAERIGFNLSDVDTNIRRNNNVYNYAHQTLYETLYDYLRNKDYEYGEEVIDMTEKEVDQRLKYNTSRSTYKKLSNNSDNIQRYNILNYSDRLNKL